jgi:hypothetical protein
MKILLDPALPKGEATLLPLVKGGKEGFKEAIS